MVAWFLSPVFVYECVLTARRWQTYAVRTAFVGALLVSMMVVWALQVPRFGGPPRLNELARIGEAFFTAIIGTQLVLVLLAAPAYTAGSICLDKARGTLAHMLITDLSAGEIVAGKLSARSLPVLGLLVAGLPVLVLATLLGGVAPEAVLGSFAANVAVALVTCSLAVALSVWGNKPHEVLLATYVAEVLWLLALPVYFALEAYGGFGLAPEWLKVSNPLVLLVAPSYWPGGVPGSAYAGFVAGGVGLSTALTLFATLSLRRAARRDGARRAPRSWRPRSFLPRPALDYNPVLWREWRRRLPSRWMRLIWGLYALLSVVASLTVFSQEGHSRATLAAWVNAFQFSIGLLLVSVTSVATLFEERVNGSLDVLLATPLPTPSIVWGKWLAGCRVIVPVMLLPALVALGITTRSVVETAGVLLLLLLLMAAYGALVNSLGLALATWVPRFGVALGLAVAIYVLLAADPALLVFVLHPGSRWLEGFASLSPWYGTGETTWFSGSTQRDDHLYWKFLWLLVYSAAALVLARVTLATFDRCLGRAHGPR